MTNDENPIDDNIYGNSIQMIPREKKITECSETSSNYDSIDSGVDDNVFDQIELSPSPGIPPNYMNNDDTIDEPSRTKVSWHFIQNFQVLKASASIDYALYVIPLTNSLMPGCMGGGMGCVQPALYC